MTFKKSLKFQPLTSKDKLSRNISTRPQISLLTIHITQSQPSHNRHTAVTQPSQSRHRAVPSVQPVTTVLSGSVIIRSRAQTETWLSGVQTIPGGSGGWEFPLSAMQPRLVGHRYAGLSHVLAVYHHETTKIAVCGQCTDLGSAPPILCGITRVNSVNAIMSAYNVSWNSEWSR